MVIFKILMLIFNINSCSAIDISDRVRNVSIELLYHTQTKTNGHMVIAPFGVWSLMAGVSIGTNGESYKQLKSALRLPKQNILINDYKNLIATLTSSSSEVTIVNKNILILDKEFYVNQTLQTVLDAEFGIKMKKIDFRNLTKTSELANDYVKELGVNVTSVFKPMDFQYFGTILTDIVAFKGTWSNPFDKLDTFEEKFYDENDTIIGRVNMMYQQSVAPVIKEVKLKANILELSYGKNEKYSMLFILPFHGINIIDVYKNLGKVNLKHIIDELRNANINKIFDTCKLEVKIPRFKFSTNVVLNGPLNDIGIYDIFNIDSASFTLGYPDFYISYIIHKADIEVTEGEIVESAKELQTRSDSQHSICEGSFIANKPFIYFLVEKSTATIIFSGIYSKPSVY